MTTYEKMMNDALEMLKNDDDVFCDMIDELDSWNGYADGFRCYYMEELNDIFCDMKVTDFLDKLGREFNHNDDFFMDTIWGIESTNDKTDVYRNNVDEGELLDEIIKYANHLYFNDSDFEALIDNIVNYTDDNETDAA